MILHLDADAFFASVEQAEHPELRGKAMAVGGQRRGIIASASYEARRRGVYTPMPSSQALQRCPELILVPGDFSKYRIYSDQIFALAEELTPMIERSSIDEGYFDLGGRRQINVRAEAEALQQKVSQQLGITVSLGIGSNKLVAQIASKLKKPNAIVEVEAGKEQEFLWPLGSHWLPGVGEKLGARLREVGLGLIEQVATVPLEFLAQVAGSYAKQLQAYARGIDPRPVEVESGEAKSYGMQETFEEPVSDRQFVIEQLQIMADELMHKVRRDGRKVRTVTVYLRYRDLREASHGRTLSSPSELETDVYPLLSHLLAEVWTGEQSLRLIGLRLSQPESADTQTQLEFTEPGVSRQKQEQVARLLDAMRARSLPLVRAHTLRSEGSPPR